MENIYKILYNLDMEYLDYYSSPIGQILLTSDGENLTGLKFTEECIKQTGLPVFENTKNWLDIYFSGKQPNFTPKIKLTGTKFQLSVWKIIEQIPYGTTVTYSHIAQLGNTSARAAGNAIGKNKILIILPCHRIIGANGKLTGYSGGIERKMKLLKLENCL